MSLRLKLLLAAMCTLALPWAGWQFVGQTERLLREGQEQAWLVSTSMFAKALLARSMDLPAGGVLYAQRARSDQRRWLRRRLERAAALPAGSGSGK